MTALTNSCNPTLPMYSSPCRQHAQGAGSPFQAPCLEQFLWNSLFDCACDLNYLTYYLEAYQRAPSKIGPIEIEFFEDTFAAVLHGLSAFPRPESTLTKSYMYYRQNCWRIAATIYLNIFVRECPSPYVMYRFTQDLLVSFSETTIRSSWDSAWKVLLWCLFMGYCGSETFEYQGWFYTEIMHLCQAKGIETFDALERIIEAGPYRQCLVSQLGRKLFEYTE